MPKSSKKLTLLGFGDRPSQMGNGILDINTVLACPPCLSYEEFINSTYGNQLRFKGWGCRPIYRAGGIARRR
ncbi:MAG: hypothetical protein AAGC93_29775 [Cyanobacteria bacterium P01_F01_bin.53]